jgi:succinate dehydrogenase / fumarate reductase cytochrome b subunit
MKQIERPLSPHIGIYKWQITMFMSILHRMTGVFLSIGLIMLTGWLLAIASGGDQYSQFLDFIRSTFGRLLMVAWSYAFFYHLCNGIRHLFWDTGKGFEIDQVKMSGVFAIVMSLLLTAVTWYFLLGGGL